MNLKKSFIKMLILVFPACFITAQTWPTNGWETATPAAMGMDQTKLEEARDYALQGGGAGFITRSGKLVFSWGDTARKWDVKSATKSVGFSTVGLAIKDGLMNLHDKAQTHHTTFGTPPSGNASTGWLDDITIEHLATQTAGFDKSGGYTALLFAPGTRYYYSDGGPNWLAECVTLVYRKDIEYLFFERLGTPMGLNGDDLHWRNNSYRNDLIDGIKRREFGAGVHANADAMARIGYLYLRRGQWEGTQLLPASFVDTVHSPPSFMDTISDHSGNCCGKGIYYAHLWWHNRDGHYPDVPQDAYWAWGMWGNHIFVVPSLDLVASRVAHDYLPNRDPEPFFNAITASVLFSDRDIRRKKSLSGTGFTVSPNPVHVGGTIYLSGIKNNTIIRIYNLHGKLIRSTENMQGSVLKWPCNGLQPGLLLIKVSQGSISQVKKILLLP